MTIFSQKDYRWKNQRLGWCKDTIGSSGCMITCLAMFADRNPSEVNQKFKAEGGYTRGCLTTDRTSAKILELEYKKRVYKESEAEFPCIAETNHYKASGVPQHFFVMLDNNTIIDPLDPNPAPKPNKYKVISYRLFKPKIMEDPIIKLTVELLKELGVKAENKANVNELDKGIKKVKAIKKNVELLEDAYDRLDAKWTSDKIDHRNQVRLLNTTISNQKGVINELTTKIADNKKEITKLKEVSKKNFEAVGIIQLLKEIFNKIINF